MCSIFRVLFLIVSIGSWRHSHAAKLHLWMGSQDAKSWFYYSGALNGKATRVASFALPKNYEGFDVAVAPSGKAACGVLYANHAPLRPALYIQDLDGTSALFDASTLKYSDNDLESAYFAWSSDSSKVMVVLHEPYGRSTVRIIAKAGKYWSLSRAIQASGGYWISNTKLEVYDGTRHPRMAGLLLSTVRCRRVHFEQASILEVTQVPTPTTRLRRLSSQLASVEEDSLQGVSLVPRTFKEGRLLPFFSAVFSPFARFVPGVDQRADMRTDIYYESILVSPYRKLLTIRSYLNDYYTFVSNDNDHFYALPTRNYRPGLQLNRAVGNGKKYFSFEHSLVSYSIKKDSLKVLQLHKSWTDLWTKLQLRGFAVNKT